MAYDAAELERLRQAATIRGITPEEEAGFMSQAQSIYAPVKEAASAKFAANKAATKQEFADLVTKIRQRTTAEQTGLRQDLTNRGFLRSGEQVGVGERIATQGLGDINRADIQRALSEANLALEEAGYNVDISNKIGAYGQSLSEREYEKRKREADVGATNLDYYLSINKPSGGSGSGSKASKIDYEMTQKEDGGLGLFRKSSGKPVTLREYVEAYEGEDVTPADFLPYLQMSENPEDRKIVMAIQHGYSADKLRSMFPWVFG